VSPEVVAILIIFVVLAIRSALPKRAPRPFTADELEAIEEHRQAIADDRIRQDAEKEDRRKLRRVWLGIGWDITFRVGGGLLLLYFLVRFVKWAWTD